MEPVRLEVNIKVSKLHSYITYKHIQEELYNSNFRFLVLNSLNLHDLISYNIFIL